MCPSTSHPLGRRCAGFTPPVKPLLEVAQPQKSGLRRSIGVHRILFITTVFAIMALFLLLFTNGRMHAQRAMRYGNVIIPSIPVALSALPAGRDTRAMLLPSTVGTAEPSSCW